MKILELFGGIGSPRCALRNIGIDAKSIGYVEIDEKAVKSYNSMFDNNYKTETVVGWNLQPDILIHGSPCQDFSIAGKQKGADKGSDTRSSLMWETIKIIKNFGVWKPKVVIWENVKNIRSKLMVHNHEQYIKELNELGYKTTYKLLDARDFGVPQARQRYFTVSVLGNNEFNFDLLKTKEMDSIDKYLLKDSDVDDRYTIKSRSMLNKIPLDGIGGGCGYDNLTIINKYAMTITTKQNRCPNSGIVKRNNGEYRLLTELECWRLMGFSDEDYYNALKANPNTKNGCTNGILYKQAGNSIVVQVLEAIFREIINQGFVEQ